MIGPGGLILVVPTYMQFQLQFYWWGCRNKTAKLTHLILLSRVHTEHLWRCPNYKESPFFSSKFLACSLDRRYHHNFPNTEGVVSCHTHVRYVTYVKCYNLIEHNITLMLSL